jgi:hypothetical protein
MKGRQWLSAWLIFAGAALLVVSCWAWHKNTLLNPLRRSVRHSLKKPAHRDQGSKQLAA